MSRLSYRRIELMLKIAQFKHKKRMDEEKLKIEREKIDKGISDKPVINIDLSGLEKVDDI